MRLGLPIIAAALLSAAPAHAQLQLPGAAGGAPVAKAPTEKSEKPEKAKAPARTLRRPNVVASLYGRVLKLNGVNGDLELAKGDGAKTLRIVKLILSGEVISDPDQKCEINIVADSPIEAKAEGSSDGPPRYAADIPACPLSFEVLRQAVLAPPQTGACVFQAADCQASPSGLWGPDAATLTPEAKAIARDRARAEKSIDVSVKTLEKADKSATETLEKESADFAAERDEACHDYAGEADHDFCHARLTERRAEELLKRVGKTKKTGEESSD
jgi:hypothetical protein